MANRKELWNVNVKDFSDDLRLAIQNMKWLDDDYESLMEKDEDSLEWLILHISEYLKIFNRLSTHVLNMNYEKERSEDYKNLYLGKEGKKNGNTKNQ